MEPPHSPLMLKVKHLPTLFGTFSLVVRAPLGLSVLLCLMVLIWISKEVEVQVLPPSSPVSALTLLGPAKSTCRESLSPEPKPMKELADIMSLQPRSAHSLMRSSAPFLMQFNLMPSMSNVGCIALSLNVYLYIHQSTTTSAGERDHSL